MAATTETVEEFDTSFRNVLAPAKIPRTLVVTEKIPISIGDFVFTPPAAAFTVDVSGENGKDGDAPVEINLRTALQPANHGIHGAHAAAHTYRLERDGDNITIVNPADRSSPVQSGSVGDACVARIDASGGDGGKGGHNRYVGGHGGDGGNGGYVRLVANDPAAFMLTDVDVSGGKRGTGDHGIDILKKSPLHGRPGADGFTRFVVLDGDGRIKEQGQYRYELALMSYEFGNEINDSILEPGEKISVHAVCVKNVGSITLPAGALFTFLSTSTIAFEKVVATLPELAPGQEYTIPDTFHAQIIVEVSDPVMPGQYSGQADFAGCGTFLGRPFRETAVQSVLELSFPVSIGQMTVPRSVSPGEPTEIAVKIVNKSSAVYGVSEDTQVAVRFLLDKRMTDKVSPNQTIAEDGSVCIELPVKNIPVGGSQEIKLQIPLLPEGIQPYDHYHWKVELLLRGKKIEFDVNQMTVIPTWVGPGNAEAVLFVPEQFSFEEAEAWKSLFQALKLSYVSWDIVGNNGYAPPPGKPGWGPASPSLPNKRLLIFPNPTTLGDKFAFPYAEIMQHLSSFKYLTDPKVEDVLEEDWGVVFLGRAVGTPFIKALPPTDLSGDFSDVFRVTKPDESDAEDRAKTISARFKKSNGIFPTHCPPPVINLQEAKEGGFFQGSLWTFGKLVGHVSPVKGTSTVHALCDYTTLGMNYKELSMDMKTTSFVTMVTSFAKVFRGVLHSLPLRYRLNFVLDRPDIINATWSMYASDYRDSLEKFNDKVAQFFRIREARDDKEPVSFLDFMMISIYRSLVADVYRNDKHYPHFRTFVALAKERKDQFRTNPNVQLIYLYAMKRAHILGGVMEGFTKKFRPEVDQLLFDGGRKNPAYAKVKELAKEYIAKHRERYVLDMFFKGDTHLLDPREHDEDFDHDVQKPRKN